MEALLLSAALVFVAELGDKSQLMAIAFSTRYRARTVLIGLAVSTITMSLISSLLGRYISHHLDTDILRTVAGFAFLIFAGLSMLPPKEIEVEKPVNPSQKTAVIAVAATFALAELGDKTMLATMALATQHPWYWIWIGSSLGMIASGAIAVFAGRAIISRLPAYTVRYVAAAAFSIVGIAILVS